MLDLSIILPVHNEEKEIAQTLEKIVSQISGKHISYELLCVENGSLDNSLVILKKLTHTYKHLRVLQSEKGWGNAVAQGITQASGKYICYMVSDGQVDAVYIPQMYEAIKQNPQRVIKVKRITRENFLRFANSCFYNLLARILFGIQSNDINGTPKIIAGALIKNETFISKNIAFDLELLIKLKKKHIPWIEIPVHSIKRNSGSSSTKISSVLEMLSYMMKFRFL